MLANLTTSAIVSKGALFRYTEELARAVIEAGQCPIHVRAQSLPHRPQYPRSTVFRLITEIPDQPGTDPTLLATRVADYQPLTRRAGTQGDLRDDDPDPVAPLLVETFTGLHLPAAVTGRSHELPARPTTAWDLLLLGLVDGTTLDYFVNS
jgi:hypothetical protein